VLADARAGNGGVLVVTGEPGVGKTALLDDTVDHATGMRVVRVAGIEAEAAMPFGTLFDVCRPFMSAVTDLPERQRRALEGALAIGPAADGDQFAIGAATLSLLAADARDAPLLLVSTTRTGPTQRRLRRSRSRFDAWTPTTSPS